MEVIFDVPYCFHLRNIDCYLSMNYLADDAWDLQFIAADLLIWILIFKDIRFSIKWLWLVPVNLHELIVDEIYDGWPHLDLPTDARFNELLELLGDMLPSRLSELKAISLVDALQLASCHENVDDGSKRECVGFVAV